MNGYLGEKIIHKNLTPYALYEKKDWALLIIEKHGGHNGSHHKDWVLDQVSRVLNGCEVVIKLASWKDGTKEYRFDIPKETKQYKKWVKSLKDGEEGPNTYNYSTGIAP